MWQTDAVSLNEHWHPMLNDYSIQIYFMTAIYHISCFVRYQTGDEAQLIDAVAPHLPFDANHIYFTRIILRVSVPLAVVKL